MADQEHPVRVSEDGRADYVCGRCGAVLPGGCHVHASYGRRGKLSGVRVELSDGDVVHKCGADIHSDGGQ